MSSDGRDSTFPVSAQGFLGALKNNNQRDWFNANRDWYQSALVQRGTAFCEALGSALSDLTGLAIEHKVYRLNRDLRFAKDKTPYHDHYRATFGEKETLKTRGRWHFSLTADRFVLGAGVVAFSKADLGQFRAVIQSAAGFELDRRLQSLSAEGFRISEPELKRPHHASLTAPPLRHLSRRKSIAMWHDTTTALPRNTADLLEQSMDRFRALLPLTNWLEKQVFATKS